MTEQTEKRGFLGLKKIGPGLYESEYGDRLRTSDIYAGIILMVGIVGLAVCAGARMFQKSEKTETSAKPVVVQQAKIPAAIQQAVSNERVKQ